MLRQFLSGETTLGDEPGLIIWLSSRIEVGLENISGVWILVLNALTDEGESSENKDEEYDSLVKGHSENVLDHLWRDNIFLLSVWWSLQKIFLWLLSGQGERSKGIHDKVDPEKLNGSKWGLPKDDGTDEGGNQGDDIDSKLELKESSNVIINISSPFASFDNGGKVIVLNNNIGSSVGDLSTGVHGETDIGLSESWGIVGTVSSYSNDIAELSETSNHNVLIIWSRSGKDLQVLSDVLHLLDITNLFFFWLFTQNNNLFFGILVDETTDKLGEIWSSHADLVISGLIGVENTALFSDSNGSNEVVTGDHSDSNTSLVALFDGVWDFLSDDILDTSDTNEGKATLLNFVDLRSFLFIFVFFSTFILLEIFVSKTNSSKSLNSIGLNDVIEVTLDLVIEELSVAIGINVVRASFKDDFGGTFDVESSVEAVFSFIVLIKLDDGGHSLSGGVEWESDHWVAGVVVSHVGVIGFASRNELEHGDLGGRAILFGTLSVARDTLLNEVQMLLVGAESVGVNDLIAIWVLDLLIVAAPDLGPSHLVLGEGSSFV